MGLFSSSKNTTTTTIQQTYNTADLSSGFGTVNIQDSAGAKANSYVAPLNIAFGDSAVSAQEKIATAPFNNIGGKSGISGAFSLSDFIGIDAQTLSLAVAGIIVLFFLWKK